MRDYDRIYRRLHPSNPYLPYARPRELRDLWPYKQAEFRKLVDAILDGETDAVG